MSPLRYPSRASLISLWTNASISPTLRSICLPVSRSLYHPASTARLLQRTTRTLIASCNAYFIYLCLLLQIKPSGVLRLDELEASPPFSVPVLAELQDRL